MTVEVLCRSVDGDVLGSTHVMVRMRKGVMKVYAKPVITITKAGEVGDVSVVIPQLDVERTLHVPIDEIKRFKHLNVGDMLTIEPENDVLVEFHAV